MDMIFNMKGKHTMLKKVLLTLLLVFSVQAFALPIHCYARPVARPVARPIAHHHAPAPKPVLHHRPVPRPAPLYGPRVHHDVIIDVNPFLVYALLNRPTHVQTVQVVEPVVQPVVVQPVITQPIVQTTVVQTNIIQTIQH